MKQSFTRPMLFMGALSLLGMPGGWTGGEVSQAEAAPWLAPAPNQDLFAKWVKDIDQKLRSPQFRNIFMNIPGGSPQATIVDLLNEAAEGLQNGHPEYARKLVRQAVNVLDKSADRGWYTDSDIRPIQAMILKNARKGFQEAGYQWKNQMWSRQMTNSNNRDNDQRSSQGVQLFDPDEPNSSRDRWKGYTDDHWQAGDESHNTSQQQSRNEPRARNIRQNSDSFDWNNSRERSSSRNRTTSNNDRYWPEERGGTARYYSDEFYYEPVEERTRGNRFSSRDFEGNRMERDSMSQSIRENRRLHTEGRSRFYQDRPEDSGRTRPYDRGPGQDQYFESTTRSHSRGYNR